MVVSEIEKHVINEFFLLHPVKSILKLNSDQSRDILVEFFEEQGLKYLSNEIDEIMSYTSNILQEISRRMKPNVRL